MTVKPVGDRREKAGDRRKIQKAIDFPDRRSIDRREAIAKRTKKIVVLGFDKIKDNKEIADQMTKMVREKGLEYRVSVENSVELLEFVRHGVILAPGVIVDGKLKSAGKKPSKKDIKKWLSELHESIIKVSDTIDEMSKEDFDKEFGDDK